MSNRHPQATWSDDEVDQLKRMWADGATASEIERAIPGKSRNAILGKIHRLKLPDRAQDVRYAGTFTGSPKISPPKDRRKANPSFVSSGAKLRIEAARTEQKHRKIAPPMAGNQRAGAMILGDGPPTLHAEPTQIRSEVWKALPGTDPVPLTDRTGCHWPIGDDSPFLMCNAKIESGVYCATHNRTSRSAYNVRR